ncbi:MAG TPA: PAS domain S-box protein [Gemmatimonadota bacterium]|nr:PAS domain S-box protein [Gemmatimonadota bacterium]
MVEARKEARADCDATEYRALFESAPDGIVLVDDQGAILDVNPLALEMFGYAREELLGHPIEVLVPPGFRGGHVAEREAYMAEPRARPMGIGLELWGCRKDGSEFPVEISLSPMTVGNSRQVISIIRDVTERRRLQAFGAEALRAAEEERQRIARELHDDTAQRLAGLMLMLRVAGQIEDHEERERRIEQVREEIAETADAVRRIARGLRPPALDEVGLAAALESLVSSLRLAHSLNIEMTADRPRDRLEADAELALYRIVQEALSNAVRHSGASRVAVSLQTEDGMVRAEVEDDGRGFAVDRAYGDEGQGLGMVGMRERARNAGGSLDIDSAPGAGTRVRVELPLKRRER